LKLTFFLSYIIKKFPENSNKWGKVPSVFIQPKETIKDLERNKKFKFRVKAENVYGVGEPLETTSSITVKPLYSNKMKLLLWNSLSVN
jgi:hypothetical protein